MKKKRSYIKLFSIPEIATRALAMLAETPPQPYSVIASKLGCDRSSVIYFHKKKLAEGITLKNFNGVKVEIIGGPKPLPPENVNIGKDYKDYLKKYVKKRDKLQVKNMKKARKTIDKLHKTRIDYGVDFEFDLWEF